MSDRWYDQERSGRSNEDWDRRENERFGYEEGRRFSRNSGQGDRFDNWDSRYGSRGYSFDEGMDRPRGYGRDRNQRLDVPTPPWSRDNERRMYNDMPYNDQNYGYGRESEMYGNRDYSRGNDMYGARRDVDDRWQQRNYGREGMTGRNSGFGQDYDSSFYERNRGNQNFGNQGYDRQNRYDDQEGTRPNWSYTEVWFIPGPFSGQGPKGYKRSDERIQEDVCERLTQHGRLDARDIEVKVNDGEVTLTGTVDSRQAKRIAEDSLESVTGVREVHNQLRVQQNQQQNMNQPSQQYGQNQASGSSQYASSNREQSSMNPQNGMAEPAKR